MPLDHGALNLPLSKRGNIDAQLDAYKADAAADAKAARKAKAAETAYLRKAAKFLFEAVSDDRVIQLALRCNVTPAAMRKQLKSDAHWQPELVIGLLSKTA